MMTTKTDNVIYSDKALYQYAPEELSLGLSVELYPKGFSFSVRNVATGCYLALGEVPVPLGGSPRRLLELFVRFFETARPFNTLSFDRADIVYRDKQFTLVPSILFDEGKASDLLSFSLGRSIPAADTGIGIADTAKTVCIFERRPDFVHYLQAKARQVEEHHSADVFLKGLLQGADSCRTIHVNAGGDLLQVVAMEGKKVLLGNIFELEKEADFMYYILLAANQTDSNERETHFIFYGDPDVYQKNMLAINQCFPDYAFAGRKEGVPFSPALDFVAAYDHFNLLNGLL